MCVLVPLPTPPSQRNTVYFIQPACCILYCCCCFLQFLLPPLPLLKLGKRGRFINMKPAFCLVCSSVALSTVARCLPFRCPHHLPPPPTTSLSSKQIRYTVRFAMLLLVGLRLRLFFLVVLPMAKNYTGCFGKRKHTNN